MICESIHCEIPDFCLVFIWQFSQNYFLLLVIFFRFNNKKRLGRFELSHEGLMSLLRWTLSKLGKNCTIGWSLHQNHRMCTVHSISCCSSCYIAILHELQQEMLSCTCPSVTFISCLLAKIGYCLKL